MRFKEQDFFIKMHELSVATKVLNTALASVKDDGKTSIEEIELNIGAMNDYEPEWLQKYLDKLSVGTIAENAKIKINHMPIEFKCRACGCEFEFEKYGASVGCPGCGGINYEVVSGRQIEIARLIVTEKGEENEED